MARSCRSGELCEVVSGADDRPFGAHFVDASQQELPEPPCLLDLSEHRLDDLLSKPVPASPSRALELVPHGLGERLLDRPLAFGGVFGASDCDVSADLAIGQGLQVRLAQIPAIGRRLPRPGAEIGLDAVDQADQLAVIARAGGEPVRDDDLGLGVDGGLRVVALDITVLARKNAAVGVGEVALPLAVGGPSLWRPRLAVLLAAFRLALLFRLLAPPRLLFGGGLGFRLER